MPAFKRAIIQERPLISDTLAIQGKIKVLGALKIAIDVENGGKEYYLTAVQKSDNEAGRKLLKSLALEEDTYRRKLEEIYHAIQKKMEWPAVAFQLDKGNKLRSLQKYSISMVYHYSSNSACIPIIWTL